ncbi:MAG: hypothetical protein GEEBNDBF_01569 [bacterium]|nr:hypothetical protein [bacterium]
MRGRRLPSADELRFFAWFALFNRSEGFPVFAQFHVSSQRLQERFLPVAQEIDRFSDLRVYHDLATWEGLYSFDPAGDPDIFAKVVTYTKPPGYPNPLSEVWLFVYNRKGGPAKTNIRFEFKDEIGFKDGAAQVFRPYRFGEAVVDSEDLPVLLAFQLQAAGSISLPGERIAMFKLEPFVP